LSAQDASLATLDEAARDFLEAARDLPLAEWVIELVPLDRSPIAQVLFLGFGVVLLTAFALRLCRHHSDPSDWWQGKIRTSIPYEPDENILASLLRFEGTALQLVFAKPLYWALIAMHIGLRHANDHFLMLPPLDSTVLVGLPSSLLIFLVVFYGGNCYQRYYELWEHLSALNAGVYNWVLQTGFIYSPLEMNHEHLNKIASKLHGVGRNDGTDEKAKNERYRRIRLAAMWRCSRRMLAAFHLLIRTVDPDDPSSSGGLNFLGQVRREWSMRESPFKGRGLEEEDYKQLMQLQLLRKPEVESLKYYGTQKGALQFIVPIKWALDDLVQDCRPETRMMNSARNYEAMQQIAADFQARALMMVTLLQQPVPLAYYHILKLMQVLVNLLISYAFVDIFKDEWWVSVVVYAIVAGMLLGLQEIAVSMSNPFGEDSTDFDTRTLCHDAYNNAIAYLSMSSRYENPKLFGLMGNEEGIENPLLRSKAYTYSIANEAMDEDAIEPSEVPSKSSPPRLDGYSRLKA